MARFIFTLQPVLEMREREEEQKKTVLAQLETNRLQIEDRIRGYQQNIELEQSSLAQMLVGKDGIDLRGARLQANAAIKNRFSAQKAVLELAGLHNLITQARAELGKASAARKAVEMLKEKQRQAFDMEQRRRESSELDDISVMRHARREGHLL